MPTAYLDVSPELLAQLLRGLEEGGEPRRYKVVENGLPPDAELVSVSLTGSPRVPRIRLYVRAEAFVEGQELPSVVMQSVRE